MSPHNCALDSMMSAESVLKDGCQSVAQMQFACHVRRRQDHSKGWFWKFEKCSEIIQV